MTCPSINCVLYDADMEPNNLCMQHEGIGTTNHKIKLRNCNDIPNQLCDLFSDFAWTESATYQVDTATQALEDPRKSPYYGKRTEAKCIDKNDLLESELNNGRRCLENYQCKSRNCDWNTGICMGRDVNQTCNMIGDCNAGLYCQFNSNTSISTCQPQLKLGQTCTEDFDCLNTMGCTRINLGANTTTTSVCIPYNSLSDASVFKWELSKYGNLRNSRNMTKEAVLGHGRFCKSGFAARFDTDSATCITIARVSLPTDTPDSLRSGAVKCDFTSGIQVQCQYQLPNSTNTLFSLTCECSL